MSSPDNEDKIPQHIYAVLAYDKYDVEYGFLAVGEADVPIVSIDPSEIEDIKSIMVSTAKRSEIKPKLFKFTNPELIFETTDGSTH